MAAIPEKYADILQKKAFAQLATSMPDGSPQVSPVWVDFDGTHIVINTAKGRVKDRNMRRDPRVGIDLVDPDNPYRHLSIRGRVTGHHRKRRRRAYRQNGQEIPGPGPLSVPRAG